MIYRENIVYIIEDRAGIFNDKKINKNLILEDCDINFTIDIVIEAANHFELDVLDVFSGCRHNKKESLQIARRAIREILLLKGYEDRQVSALLKTKIQKDIDLNKILVLDENNSYYESYKNFKDRFV